MAALKESHTVESRIEATPHGRVKDSGRTTQAGARTEAAPHNRVTGLRPHHTGILHAITTIEKVCESVRGGGLK